MAILSDTKFAQQWLENFDPQDRGVAKLLLDRLLLVSASEFTTSTTKQLNEIIRKCEDNVPCLALYAEREVAKKNHNILPFFPNSETGRAVGDGLQPVQVDPKKQDVGSEGIVAALISKYCKSRANQSLSHPGPDSLRNNRVRKIVIVTDFVGSGRRVSEMLDAFSMVASIRSWVSFGLLDFHVATYSGTERGLECVRQHQLRPQVSTHIACPVINETFQGTELGAIKLLCKKYPKKRSRFPFGFNDTGSLMVFSHGIPNNAPSLLHSSAGGWKPLFEGRSTLASELDKYADSGELLVQNSERVLGIREARKVLADAEGELWAHTMLILKALCSGARTLTKLSAITQIPFSRVEEIVVLAQKAGWVNQNTSLTRLGRRELKWAKMFNPVSDEFAFPESRLYFPNQLRAS